MKKLLLLGTMLLMVTGLTACGGATRTTENWVYNHETNKYELESVEKEEIDGIFDEKVINKCKVESNMHPL